MPPKISINSKMEDIDVIILCGGKGTRLKEAVDDRPKSMAEINERPFLDYLIEYVPEYGFKRFILCTGYLGQMIQNHYEKKYEHLQIIYSEEDEPLGTGGALKNARSLIKSRVFLVLNGDTFCPVNLSEFLEFHLSRNSLFSVALKRIKGETNSGKVSLDNNKKIINFEEKGKADQYSNVGVYLMDRKIFSLMGDKEKFSLEYDLFPTLITEDCYGFITEADFIDIGTPERYEKAKEYFKRIESGNDRKEK